MPVKSAKKSSAKTKKTRIDTELVKQVKTASENDQLVEAVVRLKPDNTLQIVPNPERTDKLAKRLLERVEKRSGKAASRYNVFRNLGSFVVSAPADFIKELTSQPEVAAVAANRQPGSALIPPIRPTTKRKKAVTAKSKTKRGRRVSTTSKKSARKSAR